jgi:VIT1/CCC1 family predicted Fe2+/Mn2+ transporter
MKNIKTFENFKEERINEGLLDFIKKLPIYTKIVEIYNKVKDELTDMLKDLGEEDKEKLLSSVNISESINEGKFDVNKILRKIGLSTGALGLISNAISMVTYVIEQNGYTATPWFILGVILLAIGGITHISGLEFKEEKVLPGKRNRNNRSKRRKSI